MAAINIAVSVISNTIPFNITNQCVAYITTYNQGANICTIYIPHNDVTYEISHTVTQHILTVSITEFHSPLFCPVCFADVAANCATNDTAN
jgi:hypothetical protein